jgi:methylated-DNA-protein-cysteine methyltransferase related protein
MNTEKRKFSQLYQRIYDVVRRIPSGHVATYGQIANLAGLPGQARLVGYALHSSPDHLVLPWHRVINARGTISLSEMEASYHEQRALLQSEGIIFTNDRIDLQRFRWNPDMDGNALD